MSTTREQTVRGALGTMAELLDERRVLLEAFGEVLDSQADLAARCGFVEPIRHPSSVIRAAKAIYEAEVKAHGQLELPLPR